MLVGCQRHGQIHAVLGKPATGTGLRLPVLYGRSPGGGHQINETVDLVAQIEKIHARVTLDHGGYAYLVKWSDLEVPEWTDMTNLMMPRENLRMVMDYEVDQAFVAVGVPHLASQPPQ